MADVCFCGNAIAVYAVFWGRCLDRGCAACSATLSVPGKLTRMITHYEALGIPRDASAERIKRAYRSLVKVCHPDLFPGGSEAEVEAGRRIREINAAYAVLSNARARASYDAKLEAAPRAPSAAFQERQPRRHSEPIPEYCSQCRKPTTYWDTAGGKTVRLCYACGGIRH
jgi:hypothetical protein